MTGKTIVITGASDGIGAAAARRLAADGHHVVIVGRSPEKTRAVAQELGTEFYVVDFTELSEVDALARQLLAKYPRIDVLANNAGVFSRVLRATEDGHEMTFQVNYLSSYLLTTRLLDHLIGSRATVIFTSSIGQSILGNIDIDDLENGDNYCPLRAYCNSKLAQVLFARELHRRYRQSGLAAVAFDPSNIASNMVRNPNFLLRWTSFLSLPEVLGMLPGTSGGRPLPETAAETLVFLAEGLPGLDFPSGEYFVKTTVAKPNKQALDPSLARELWKRSEAMVGLARSRPAAVNVHSDQYCWGNIG